MLHYVCRRMVRRSAAGFAQAPRGSERPLQCPPLCRHIRHVREGMLLPHHQLQAQGGHLALARVCTAHHEIMTLINRVLVKMPGIKWVLMGRTDPRERKNHQTVGLHTLLLHEKPRQHVTEIAKWGPRRGAAAGTWRKIALTTPLLQNTVMLE